MTGAVFFDRDGVLNVDTGYLHRAEDFRWVDGAPEAVAAVRAAGLRAIVVTNQSGIARGYYDEDAMERLHAFIDTDLKRRGIGAMDAWYHCPYHEQAIDPRWRVPDHPDRKPNPGMILKAMARFGLDPRRCLIVGDNASDIEAARRAGIAGLLFTGGRLDAQLVPTLAALTG